MAKTKVVYSEDATTLIFKGNPKSPEVSTGIIKFPGGYVEVTRTSDNQYWAHICVDEGALITNSRLAYGPETMCRELFCTVHDLPEAEHITQMSIKINGPYLETGE